MKTTLVLLTCLIILIAASCDDKGVEPNPLSEAETQIIGNWLWLESCGGIDGNCTDTSAFGTEGITFTKEGLSYQWCPVCFPLLADYKIVRKTSYTYGQDTIVTAIVRTFEDSPLIDLIIKQLDDTGLTLIQDCGDCYVTSYSRIQTTDITIVDPGGVGP
ncbi:MAG: hypothetical protein V3S17_05430 [candidate division Zixibacteria bacterium]